MDTVQNKEIIVKRKLRLPRIKVWWAALLLDSNIFHIFEKNKKNLMEHIEETWEVRAGQNDYVILGYYLDFEHDVNKPPKPTVCNFIKQKVSKLYH